MNDAEMWREPQTIKDVKNATGYFLVLTFVTAGMFLVFLGVICPIFIPKMLKKAKITARANPTGTYEQNLMVEKWGIAIKILLWEALAWGFIWFAYATRPF